MLIPVCCFTCGNPIGQRWKPYKENAEKYIEAGMTEMQAHGKALDDVGLPTRKYCCRRMLLSHDDIIDELLLYSNNPGEKTAPKYIEALPDGYTEAMPVIEDDDDESEVVEIELPEDNLQFISEALGINEDLYNNDSDEESFGEKDYTYIGDMDDDEIDFEPE